MTLLITKENISDLKPGDLVEFTRYGYSHWGVYVGDEEVVHLAGVDGGRLDSSSQHSFSIAGKTFDKAWVRKDNIWKVADRSEVYKNNAKDHELTPLPKRDIVTRALSKIGQAGYNLIFKNCEHFANWCRYGTETSGQVESFVIGSTVALAAVGVAGVAYWLFGSNKEKNKEKKQSQ